MIGGFNVDEGLSPRAIYQLAAEFFDEVDQGHGSCELVVDKQLPVSAVLFGSFDDAVDRG